MKVTSAEIEQCLKLLAETPRRIASASNGLENTRLHFRPDEETWSVNDILAHLRSCADVWGKSIMAMIAQDRPTLRYVSPRTWIRKTDYPELDFERMQIHLIDMEDRLLKAMSEEASASAAWRGRWESSCSCSLAPPPSWPSGRRSSMGGEVRTHRTYGRVDVRRH